MIDWLNGTVSALGLLILLGWQSERDQRIAAEERLAQVERAAETPCRSKSGYRLVSTINVDSDGDLARWCGYFRTTIETVRIEWEPAR